MKPFLHWPIDKIFITQRFGERPEVYKQFGLKGHEGIDFRTRFIDSPLGRRYVTAAADGVIEQVRFDVKGYGTHIRLRHDNGYLTIYGHLTKPYVKVGQRVKAKERIGLTGNTGFSSAPHLHFSLRERGGDTNDGFAGSCDPIPYFIDPP